jgi:NADH dehydrogenase [ubiquinone] 1 alpha subcomplex assembly factor 7
LGGLADHLRRRMALEGPLNVARYMEEALGNPRHGYYPTRDPLGSDGDFITAPEISQMFGELIGLWCAVVWQGMGGPSPLNLVELGPGRGTLMSDALRATRGVPGFAEAVRIHLVETSPALRRRQAQILGQQPQWHNDLGTLPEGPMIVIANEFFDALPVRQFQRVDRGWCERLVDCHPETQEFRFVLSPPAAEPPLIPASLRDAPPGAVFETCPAGVSMAHAMGAHVARWGGATLIIDYGHAESAIGETLQAVKGHAFHDVLTDPGEADLTTHVDFAMLGHAASQAGASAFGPVPQGNFLEALGMGARSQALLANATAEQAEDIRAAHRRLTHPDEMGTLFKALALTQPDLVPPGF